MQMLADDYGQAVVLIVFGAGLIILMGMLLGHIVSGKVYLTELSHFMGMQDKVRDYDGDILRGDTDPDAEFSGLDMFNYVGRENANSDR